MTTLAASFHHAGHAVTAHLSRFHSLAAALRTDVWGTGEVVAALSRRKLAAGAKPPTIESRADPEVASSIATILCAGWVCEQLAAERGVAIRPDPTRSSGDFEAARAELQLAGIDLAIEPFQAAAAALLAEHWHRVQVVAERLAQLGELSPEEVAAIVEAA